MQDLCYTGTNLIFKDFPTALIHLKIHSTSQQSSEVFITFDELSIVILFTLAEIIFQLCDCNMITTDNISSSCWPASLVLPEAHNIFAMNSFFLFLSAHLESSKV